VFGRPKVPAGGVGFGYHKPVLPILIVFVVVSARDAGCRPSFLDTATARHPNRQHGDLYADDPKGFTDEVRHHR